jgi:hypothetical protein
MILVCFDSNGRMMDRMAIYDAYLKRLRAKVNANLKLREVSS